MQIKSTVFFLFLFSVLDLWANGDSIRLEQRGEKYFVIHQVDQGETLYSLSRRYGVSINDIKSNNELRNGGIDVTQFLMIPVEISDSEFNLEETENEQSSSDSVSNTHIVQAKETLYGLSRQYEVSVDQLRQWNGLEDNSLEIGQVIVIKSKGVLNQSNSDNQEIVPLSTPAKEKEPFLHFVQPGETINSIARKFNTEVDSIIAWNSMDDASLAIGSKLKIRKEIHLDSLNHERVGLKVTSYGSKKWEVIENGVRIQHEEGIAGLIEDIDTQKYLILHRSLPVGTILTVVNLMNNERVLVKVVGKLPDTGINKNVMVRLTSICFRRLGIIDNQSRVDIAYEAAE